MKLLVLLEDLGAHELLDLVDRGHARAAMLRTLQIIVPVLLDDEGVERLLEALSAEGVAARFELEDALLLIFGLGNGPIGTAIDFDGIVTDLAGQRLLLGLVKFFGRIRLCFGLWVLRLAAGVGHSTRLVVVHFSNGLRPFDFLVGDLIHFSLFGTCLIAIDNNKIRKYYTIPR